MTATRSPSSSPKSSGWSAQTSSASSPIAAIADATRRYRIASGQKRRVTEKINRELRRRAAIEPVIGHLKAEHRMGRNHLAHATGDAVNAVLATVGYNSRRLLAWLALLLSLIAAALAGRNPRRSAVIAA